MMEHRALRLLATGLLPGVLVFVLLFTFRTPVLHTQSYWNNPQPLQNNEYRQLLQDKENGPSRVAKRSETPHLIGLRSVEDPGACLKDPACRGYLSGRAMDSYNQCMARVKKYGHSKFAKDNGCHFIDGRRRGVVALASFPGSGNTWVRTLLERVTGICTGSFSCDMSLRFEGFTGEGIQSPNALVVKTHQISPNWAEDKSSSHKFNSAIILVRNPLDALVSDWNRYVSNGFNYKTIHLGTHTKKAGREYFRNNSEWNSFVMRRARIWLAIIENWIINNAKSSHKHKILVVMYEDLKENKNVEIERMLKFLKVDSLTKAEDHSNNTSNVNMTQPTPLKNFTGIFHRKHSSNEELFEPYTTAQKAHVLDVISQAQKRLVKYNLTPVLDVSRYLTKEDKALLAKFHEENDRTSN